MSNLIIRLIKLYQKFSRIFLPNRCRFYPSCSQYAVETIQKYGIFYSLGRILRRILKCSPLSPGGYDPVK